LAGKPDEQHPVAVAGKAPHVLSQTRKTLISQAEQTTGETEFQLRNIEERFKTRVKPDHIPFTQSDE
jgi:hypothetical protein